MPRVLVVDDEKLIVKGIRFSLEQDGMEVDCAYDGEEAVERVYEVLRNFICAGEKTGDGRLRFTVSYEKFFYRKIHMALMALDDLVEELEPEEVARVICKRRENKGEHT